MEECASTPGASGRAMRDHLGEPGRVSDSDRLGPPRSPRKRVWGIVMASRDQVATEPGGGNESSPHQHPPHRGFGGRRSGIQRTLDLLAQLLDRRRTFLAVPSALEEPAGSLSSMHEGPLLTQPAGAGTWATVLLAVTYLHERDPDAIVVTCPWDQEVLPEDRFIEHLRELCHFASLHPDRLFVSGIRFTQAGSRGGPGRLRRNLIKVGRFWIMETWCFRASTLWKLGWSIDSEAMSRFDALRRVLHAAAFERVPSDHVKIALSSVFRALEPAGLSSSLLRRAREAVRVVPMEGIQRRDPNGRESALQVRHGQAPIPASLC